MVNPCKKYFNKILLFSLLLIIFLAATECLVFAQSDLTIGSYELVSKTRVSRTAYDYTYRVKVSNQSNKDLINVTASITSLVPSVSVIDGNLTFGNIIASTTAQSTDTFKIRINLTTPFEGSNIDWKFYYNYAFTNIDQLLAGVKQSIAVGDIDKIIKHFDKDIQDKYREIFEFNIAELPSLSDELNTLEVLEMGTIIAVYKYKYIDYDGTQLTDQIMLEKGADDIWRIISF